MCDAGGGLILGFYYGNFEGLSLLVVAVAAWWPLPTRWQPRNGNGLGSDGFFRTRTRPVG